MSDWKCSKLLRERHFHALFGISFDVVQIDVRTSKDVTVAFEFSRRTRVPLVIKNTGVSER